MLSSAQRLTLREPVFALSLACIVVVVGVLGAWGIATPRGPETTGDSYWVAHGAETIVDCLRHGIHTHCDARGGVLQGQGRFLGVGPYPPPQYLVALVTEQIFGGSIQAALQVFTHVNLAAFALLLLLGAWLGRRARTPWLSPVLVLLVLASPLSYFTHENVGESLSTLLVAVLAATVLVRARWGLIALAAMVATLTKETIAPFVLLLGGVGLWCTTMPDVRPLRRRDWAALLGGVAAGQLTHVAFNVLRYGTLYNADYTRHDFGVHDAGTQLKFSAAVLFSPNGGVLCFWPLAVALLGLGLAASVRGLRRDRRAVRSWLPGVTGVLLVLGQGIVLGHWYSPFGWTTWGARLMFPMVPAAVLLSVVLHRADIEDWLGALLRRAWRVDVLAVVLVLLSLPSIAVMFDFGPVGAFFAVNASCPAPNLPPAQSYYHCIVHRAWDESWLPLKVLGGLRTPEGAMIGVALAIAIVGLVGGLRSALQRESTAPTPRFQP